MQTEELKAETNERLREQEKISNSNAARKSGLFLGLSFRSKAAPDTKSPAEASPTKEQDSATTAAAECLSSIKDTDSAPIEACKPKLELNAFPIDILSKILSMSSPHLAKARKISKDTQKVIDRYVDSQANRYREIKEEARCWGHPVPQLVEFINNDPLVVETIIARYFVPKTTAARRQSAEEAAYLKSLYHFKQQLMRAFEVSVQQYEEYWTVIPILRRFIHQYRLPYLVATRSAESKPVAIKQITEVQDSLDSLIEPTNASAVQQETFVYEYSKSPDTQWLQWNSDLFVAASQSAHLHNLPPLSHVTAKNRQELLETAIQEGMKLRHTGLVHIILETARASGDLLSILEKAIEIAVQDFSLNHRNSELVVVLLNYVFNDKQGPVSANQTNERSKEIVLLAQELITTQGISWHYSEKRQRWRKMTQAEALAEIFDA